MYYHFCPAIFVNLKSWRAFVDNIVFKGFLKTQGSSKSNNLVVVNVFDYVNRSTLKALFRLLNGSTQQWCEV